jgi:hypothetical protein
VAGGVALDQLWVVCAALVPTGAGIGLLLSPMTTVALSAVPAVRTGPVGPLTRGRPAAPTR